MEGGGGGGGVEFQMSFVKFWPVVSCLFCQLLHKCFLIINYETYLSIYDRKSS